MVGVEKITDVILGEARAKADELLSEAQTRSQEMYADARRACETIYRESRVNAEKVLAEQKERTSSAADMRMRQAMLAVKQGIIDEMLEAAEKKMATQDPGAYFEMILSILAGAVHAGAGEICFSEADLARMPADFSAKVDAVAKAKNGKLVISKNPERISDGFILKYGGVEENCTLQAIFAERRDALRDQVSAMLWQER